MSDPTEGMDEKKAKELLANHLELMESLKHKSTTIISCKCLECIKAKAYLSRVDGPEEQDMRAEIAALRRVVKVQRDAIEVQRDALNDYACGCDESWIAKSVLKESDALLKEAGHERTE